MKTSFSALMALLLLCTEAHARDAFDAVRCGSDIRNALLGKDLPGGPAVAIEGRHKAIGLKGLGADDITDRLQLISWRMCDGEYALLVDGNVVRDVLPFPPHSRSEPEFGGSCQMNGKAASGYVVAILDNKAGQGADGDRHYSPDDKTLLAAETAWKIDEKRRKFVKIDARGLRCARSGINTVDGGP